MAFFDNFGKKASEVAAKTMQKTHELAETTKLNSQIAEEEKKIDSMYYQIGKLYVSLHRSDCEEELSGMLKQILDSEALIAQIRKNIQSVRKVQRCEKCGAEVAMGVAFCSTCGAPMPKVDSADSFDGIICEKCGAHVKKGMRFCTACGTPVQQSPVIPVKTEDTVPKTVPAEDTSEEDFTVCPKCGAKISKDVAFCTECGEKLKQ